MAGTVMQEAVIFLIAKDDPVKGSVRGRDTHLD